MTTLVRARRVDAPALFRALAGHRPSPTVAMSHLAVFGLIGLAAMGVDFRGTTASMLEGAAILLFGLPHGSLDIALFRRRGEQPMRRDRILLLYLLAGAAMALLWWTLPTLALATFLTIAVAHFAEDWDETGSSFLATGIALAQIGAPTLLHRAEVGTIFATLTRGGGGALGDVILLATPLGMVIAAAGVIALISAGRFARAGAAVSSLAALIVLPPALGFALSFCLFHSPRHFNAAVVTLGWRRARQWVPVAVPITLAAVALVAVVAAGQDGALTQTGLLPSAFIALSILTVPHLAVPGILDALRGRRARERGVRAG